jgi:osmotically-inducible protein OsmY
MSRAETGIAPPSHAPFIDLSDTPAPQGPAPGATRDAYIAGRLVTAYALCEQLAPFCLQVDVKDGVVLLSGVVDDKVLRELATDIAEDVDGVREVRSEIAVETGAPHRDPRQDGFAQRFENANLCARVKTRLLWNGTTHGAGIEVSAENGTVTLSGTVETGHVRQIAGQLASEVRGCVHVENRLEVRSGN